MMEAITVWAKIKMTASVTSDYPVGSTATIIYIDEVTVQSLCLLYIVL